MKKKFDVLFATIFILCLVSLLMYAFTGLGVWSPTEGPSDPRRMVLFLIHVIGFFGPLLYPLFRCELENT